MMKLRRKEGDAMDKLLTVRQAAEFLALRPSTIRKMIFERRLPVVRIGRSVRIKESDLDGIVRDGYRRPLEV
jgi:excisionase family DNA binding protein